MLLVNLRKAAGLRRLFVADGEMRAVAFHPTRPDALLAFAGTGGNTYLAGLAEPFAKRLKTCSADDGVSALAFDPGGRLLAAGCGNGSLSVWLIEGWRKLGESEGCSTSARSGPWPFARMGA